MKKLIILIIVLIISYFALWYNTIETIEITITEKERIVKKSSDDISSKYLIFAEINNESVVFENTDSFLFFKFSSSNFQGKLKVGSSYTVKTVGWRIPIFSTYKNIVKIY